jgi:hypothetical protein
MTRVDLSQEAPSVEPAKITLRTYSRDGVPGYHIDGYEAQYLDQTGKPIAGLERPRQPLQLDLPTPTGALSTGTEVQLDLVTPAVLDYGRGLKGVGFIATINCRVTFFGRDTQGNPAEVPLNYPIRFDFAREAGSSSP